MNYGGFTALEDMDDLDMDEVMNDEEKELGELMRAPRRKPASAKVLFQ